MYTSELLSTRLQQSFINIPRAIDASSSRDAVRRLAERSSLPCTLHAVDERLLPFRRTAESNYCQVIGKVIIHVSSLLSSALMTIINAIRLTNERRITLQSVLFPRKTTALSDASPSNQQHNDVDR